MRPQSTIPTPWHLWLRIAFRFTFAYFAQYILCAGHLSIPGRIPLVGHAIEATLFAPYADASLWIATHIFHLTGASIRGHGTGFGDRAVDWIAAALMLSIAALATAVWSALDRRRTNYRELFLWLRFALRLTVGVAMLWYASIKIFPIQIETPSLSVLNEPVGQLSPMTLLWTTLAFSPAYERVCGFMELAGGLMLLARPTAIAGALMTSIVMLNIVLFNLFFDVAVKLYATNLLLMCLVILAPDIGPMLRFFFTGLPARTRTLASPLLPSLRARRIMLACEAFFVLASLNPMRTSFAQRRLEVANAAHPSPLTGQWHVISATLNNNPSPFITGDGAALSDIFFEPDGRDSLRSTDGALWLGGRYDRSPNHLDMLSPARGIVVYTLAQPTPMQLILTPPASLANEFPTLTAQRVPIPTHFPLYDRGFHWINEWGFER